MMTSVPYALSMSIFSLLILSGIVQMQRYPRTAAAIARPRPVLPDVLSTSVAPGPSSPASSALRIMFHAIRSLTDPAGLYCSSLASTVRHARIRQAVQPDERSISDEVEDGLGEFHGGDSPQVPVVGRSR